MAKIFKGIRIYEHIWEKFLLFQLKISFIKKQRIPIDGCLEILLNDWEETHGKINRA